ncbi:hypothetical protein CALCODRAFT_483992 [Calocera cornea HHB12733]|uniref:FAR-17a/AIG1-like protein n=1 Tax=Calocera cornea HHB12733 TaxID=1353952 RepID=A0A165F954_9BASI|nr:hypothetical protein CALCODRAFT_483992 [Calocera cornea HHB12733]
MVQIYALLGVREPFDPELHWVTSWAFPRSVYAAIRLFLALYTLISALVDVALTAKSGGVFGYYSYFTNLSYIGIVSWFWASGVQTAFFAFREKTGYPLQRWPRFLRFMHSLLFTTIAVYPIIVLVVVWAILYDPVVYWANTYNTWDEISGHIINSVLITFEVIFSDIGPMPWWHMLFIVIGLALYLGLAYITRASQGFYTYSFLNPATQHAKLAGYIVGIGLGGCVVFILMRYIIVLRVRLTRGMRELRAVEAAGHVKQVDDSGEKA